MNLDTQTKLAIYRHFAETASAKPMSDYASSECWCWNPTERPFEWLRHFPADRLNMS